MIITKFSWCCWTWRSITRKRFFARRRILYILFFFICSASKSKELKEQRYWLKWLEDKIIILWYDVIVIGSSCFGSRRAIIDPIFPFFESIVYQIQFIVVFISFRIFEVNFEPSLFRERIFENHIDQLCLSWYCFDCETKINFRLYSFFQYSASAALPGIFYNIHLAVIKTVFALLICTPSTIRSLLMFLIHSASFHPFHSEPFSIDFIFSLLNQPFINQIWIDLFNGLWQDLLLFGCPCSPAILTLLSIPFSFIVT